MQTTDYRLAVYDFGRDIPVAGETYTITMKYNVASGRQSIVVFSSGGYMTLVNFYNVERDEAGVASKTFTMRYASGKTPADGYNFLALYQMPSSGSGASTIEWITLTRGNKAPRTWFPAPEDPASAVKTSHVIIEKDKIDIATGGKLNMQGGSVNLEAGSDMAIKSGAKLDVSSGGDFNLEGGSGSGYVGISNTRSDDVFLWAGGSIPILAPFSVFRDGDMVRAGGWILNTVKPSTARWNHIFPSEEGCYNSIYTIGGSLSLHVGVRNPDNSITTKTRIMIPDNEQVQITKNLYVDNYVSAETLIDRTPFTEVTL